MTFESQEEAVDFVKTIWKSMGGRFIPPNRPRHIDKYELLTPNRDNFMMDFENHCLEHNWGKKAEPFKDGILEGLSFYFNKPHPKGKKRHEDPEWMEMIQTQVYPNHSDVDWQEYVDWVENGGGDEWFDDEDGGNYSECLYCMKHDKEKNNPLDIWYDCDKCQQEVRNGGMPKDGRYQKGLVAIN